MTEHVGCKGVYMLCCLFVLWNHLLENSIALPKWSTLFPFNYNTSGPARDHCGRAAASSHNGAAQWRTMSQIPDRSPQVQRPGLHRKTVVLQWLCYSTPSSFPTGYLSRHIGFCVRLCECVTWWLQLPLGAQGGVHGGRTLFGSLCGILHFFCVIKPLRTTSWPPGSALKLLLINRFVETDC